MNGSNKKNYKKNKEWVNVAQMVKMLVSTGSTPETPQICVNVFNPSKNFILPST
jgi:hypothetical protein